MTNDQCPTSDQCSTNVQSTSNDYPNDSKFHDVFLDKFPRPFDAIIALGSLSKFLVKRHDVCALVSKNEFAFMAAGELPWRGQRTKSMSVIWILRPFTLLDHLPSAHHLTMTSLLSTIKFHDHELTASNCQAEWTSNVHFVHNQSAVGGRNKPHPINEWKAVGAATWANS